MSRTQKNRTDIEKLKHEVKLLREEIDSATKRIEDEAELKFKSIDIRAAKLLDGFAKKMSTLLMLAEAKIKQESFLKRCWNTLVGR